MACRTLEDLLARAGVSKGMLLQVEQARTNPSVATICRLATALGVSIASLVEAPEVPGARVVRARRGSRSGPGATTALRPG